MIKSINGYVFHISLFLTIYLTFGYLKYKNIFRIFLFIECDLEV